MLVRFEHFRATQTLSVTTMGPLDGNDFATSSEIQGDITTVKVKSDFNGFIQSVDDTGAGNFDDPTATWINTFSVGGDIAGIDGDDVGRLQVNRILSLTVKGTFFGATDPITYANCGLIEAIRINKIKINEMSTNASIVLS
jgi:hypothetical protein